MNIKTNQKGITLTSLVVYITILMMVIGVMTTVSTFFYGEIGGVIDTPKYLSEFNQFTMFFAVDVKNYNTANVTSNTIEFEEGPIYKFQENAIYRNNIKIAENIMNCTFTTSQYNVNTTAKNIINVNMKIGKDEQDSIEQNVDFTLRYW